MRTAGHFPNPTINRTGCHYSQHSRKLFPPATKTRNFPPQSNFFLFYLEVSYSFFGGKKTFQLSTHTFSPLFPAFATRRELFHTLHNLKRKKPRFFYLPAFRHKLGATFSTYERRKFFFTTTEKNCHFSPFFHALESEAIRALVCCWWPLENPVLGVARNFSSPPDESLTGKLGKYRHFETGRKKIYWYSSSRPRKKTKPRRRTTRLLFLSIVDDVFLATTRELRPATQQSTRETSWESEKAFRSLLNLAVTHWGRIGKTWKKI